MVLAERDAIRARCERLVRRVLQLRRVREIMPALSFSALGADSVDMVTMVFAAEEEFGIFISDDDAVSFATLDDLVGLVTRLLADAPPMAGVVR